MWDCPIGSRKCNSWRGGVVGGTCCDWSIYDKTGMWWHRECGWQWRMSEQITVYRLRSGPLSCDASFYCAAVKRFIHHGAALLYGLLFLIWQTAEQRPRQQSPSRHVGKSWKCSVTADWRSAVKYSSIRREEDGGREGVGGAGSKDLVTLAKQGGRFELAAWVRPLLVGNNDVAHGGNNTVEQMVSEVCSSVWTGSSKTSLNNPLRQRFMTTAHIFKHNISTFFLRHPDNTHSLFAG